MFDVDGSATEGSEEKLPEPAWCEVGALEAMLSELAGVNAAGDEAGQVEQVAVLEQLKSACAATQARITAELDGSRKQADAEAGLPAAKRGAGVADEIALARRDAKSRGNRHLGLALALVFEMPHTLAALSTGLISEWRATIMVRETALLSAEQRTEVDARLAHRLAGCGDRALARAARAVAYELDPSSATRRVRGAETDRRVTFRPAPDAMACVTAIVPAAQGAACYGALKRATDSARSAGDERSRNQVMADTLIERVTGQAAASEVPLQVGLVMTDQTLFGRGDAPAEVSEAGPIPAAIARDLLRDAPAQAGAWLHRLYTHPADGSLMAMDARGREFTGTLRDYLLTRDRLCRTPWCDAPIRHLDHIRPDSDGGATSAENGQGLCERCNYTKDLPGWNARRGPDPPGQPGAHTVEVITPTGHTYQSTTPPPPQPSTTPATTRGP